MRNYLDTKPTRAQASSPIHPLALGVTLFILASVLVLLDQIGVLAPVRGRIEQVLSPVAGALNRTRTSASDLWNDVGNSQQLQSRVESQQAQISALQATVVALQRDGADNTTLRQQLGIKERYSWASQMIPAEVTVRSPDAARRTLTIAAGNETGVRVGMAVVGQQGSGPPALVGVVEDVAPHTATVLLVTDFGSQISARVLHAGAAATGVMQGQWQHGSRLKLGQISRDAIFAIGDPVVTAGLTRQLDVDLPLRAIPADIPIGTVETSGIDGHTQIAELRPYADPDQVRTVWVVRNPDA